MIVEYPSNHPNALLREIEDDRQRSPRDGISMKIIKLGPHTTEIRIGERRMLISYETPVACWDAEELAFYRTEVKHSVTTQIHISKWLNGAKAEKKPQSYFDALLGESA